MKKNALTITVGILLMLIFVALLFTYQVRQMEVAVVTRFGRPVRDIPNPGFQVKFPWPVERVYKFDKRVQNFEGRYEETMTQDGRNLLIMVYTGWSIADPKKFFASIREGSAVEAEKILEGMVNSAKNAAVGRHPLSHFLSTDPGQLKFTEIEREIRDDVRKAAGANYGIEVNFLGIKKLGLPESITQKVFDRMTAERQKHVQSIQGDGERQAIQIRSAAELEQQNLLAEADRQATSIRGQADAEAARSFAIFEQEPRLAILLLKLSALEQTLKERSTLILDDRTPPLDLLRGVGESASREKK